LMSYALRRIGLEANPSRKVGKLVRQRGEARNDCARRTEVLRFRTPMAAHGASRRSRDKHQAAAVGGIEKKFGVGALQRLGSLANTNVDVLPTGVAELDRVLGVGGWQRGRI